MGLSELFFLLEYPKSWFHHYSLQFKYKSYLQGKAAIVSMNKSKLNGAEKCENHLKDIIYEIWKKQKIMVYFNKRSEKKSTISSPPESIYWGSCKLNIIGHHWDNY